MQNPILKDLNPSTEAVDIPLAAQAVEKHYETQPTAFVHSFGCQQNVSDGERIKGSLMSIGFGLTDDENKADLILFNTCAVRETAEDRVWGHLGMLKTLKKKNPKLIIAVCGCMMQQKANADKVRTSYPYVDLVFGTNAIHRIPRLMYQCLNKKGQIYYNNPTSLVVEGLPVERDEGVKAYLPIMQGCDNYCSYCIVPYVRGREVSREPDNIIREAEEIISKGYKDITLLGQNVNSYGKGLESPVNFAALIKRLDTLPGDFWIRFMTSHPKDCSVELIDAIATSKHVARHIHLPVQSGSNRVLTAMNRRYTAEIYMELIEYARKRIPDVTFSSDIIVGFPGETEEDFEETLKLINEVKFNTLFTFIYSKRSGTPAASMQDKLAHSDKSARMQRLLDAQSAINSQINESMVGTTVKVLVEGPGKSARDALTGRTQNTTIVEFSGKKDLIGKFVNVQIEKARNWAVFGRLI